ncbi:MAG: HAD family phosphatase [Candidatus Pseudobacter hemicellulosilyticus]|uniref:HAD family phosphatase n=1 Tax=Candidatus Pseudobacter hemicellulosilyticus TaxID=3121375 RepID=A0AAJ5WWX7_9BACT|nr:MAG: HAD family phosphatase [Pseudobacter sp.]
MNGIKNIIFDLGGVLLDLDFTKAEQQFASIGAPEFRALFDRGHVQSFIRDYEIGHISDAEFIQELIRLTGGQRSEAEVTAAWDAMLLDFPPERIAFLDQLRTRYRLFLFSNTNAIHVRYFEKLFTETFPGRTLPGLFEKAWYSHVIRMRKPDLEAFRFIVADKGLDPAETVFVDDMLMNVEGARKAGLHGLHVAPGKTIMDLGL